MFQGDSPRFTTKKWGVTFWAVAIQGIFVLHAAYLLAWRFRGMEVIPQGFPTTYGTPVLFLGEVGCSISAILAVWNPRNHDIKLYLCFDQRAKELGIENR